MKLKRLPSGYLLARWSRNLWIQWPSDRAPELADGFGWVTAKHVAEALSAWKACNE